MIVRAAATAAAVIVLAGCAHQKVAEIPAPHSEMTLTVVRAGDTVSIGWQSEAGKVYSVMYTDSLTGGHWQPLPIASNVQGTGGYLSFKDTVPDGNQRFYRLQVMPTK